jgi:hypothetical protein
MPYYAAPNYELFLNLLSLHLSSAQILSSALCSSTTSVYVLPLMLEAKFYTKRILSNIMISRYCDCLRERRSGRSSSPGRVNNFNFSTSSRPALWSIQPPIYWVPGALSPWVKRQGREVDKSPTISSEVKKPWTYTSAPPPIRLHGVVLT